MRALRGAGFALLALFAALLAAGERPAAGTGRWLREAGLESRYCTADGLRLRYVRAGRGETVVLLHGIGSSAYSWSEVLPELARRFDVVALDMPGFGLSDQPAQLDFARLVRGVVGALDQLGIERAHLVGNSLGGAVAVAVAARHPERVARLVLIDSAGFNVEADERPPLLKLIGAVPAPILEPLPVRRPMLRAALRRVFHDRARVTEERVEEYMAPLFRPGSLRALKSLLTSRAEEAADFAGLAARVRAPTLILWGYEDRWIPVEDAELFRAAIPRSSAIILRRCGHVPQEERPVETQALVASFLAGK